MAAMRYIVSDVDAAVAFCTGRLGFAVRRQFGQAMAILAGPGGRQVLCEDQSGNCVERFEAP